MAALSFGAHSSVDLEFAEGTAPVECGVPRGRALGDLVASVAEALSEPLEYPPLALSTTPGDRVVLVLDPSLPQVAQVTSAVIRSLVDAGVEPDGISVLQPQGGLNGAGDPRRLLPKAWHERITIYKHDPGKRRGLAYLAASEGGEPILLNRAIHDADLVLPIGCLHPEDAAGYYGIHSPVYPTFSDPKTLHRFRSFSSLDAQSGCKRRLRHEVDHVAWLLGVNFTIQFIPGAGNDVLHVVAGQSEAVRRRAAELYRAAWSTPVRGQASLVVAAMEGDSTRQTWQEFGRALSAAVALAEDGGAVAICCELAAEPGPAVQRMVGARSREQVMRHLRKERPIDALPAAQLAQALDHGRVYLLSQLDPALVEGLDMIPVASPAELARLTRRHASCILLANAPHAMVSVDQDF